MCNGIIRTIVSLITMFSLLTHVTEAQSLRAGDPCEYARSVGAENTSGCLWFSVGCILPVVGVIGAYLIRPDPPATLLVGKGADYIAVYADCYEGGAVGNQAKWAWIGCGSALVLVPVVYMGLFIGIIMASSR